MKGLIYKCICNCNGKVYIGQTIQTFDERKRSHIKEAFNDQCPGYNYHFHRALRKYGLDNFTWEIIDTIEMKNPEDLAICLDDLEIKYIKQYNSYHNGYNSTEGGNSPTRRTSKIKIYLEDGTLIKTLSSAREVAEVYSISLQSVRNVCRKAQNFSYINGIRYVFRYEEDDYTEQEIAINKLTKTNSLVLMYDLDGKCINTFTSPKEADTRLHLSTGAVCRNCNRNSAFVFVDGVRYIFKYINDELTFDDIERALNVKSDPKCKVTAIDSVTREVIGVYNSMSEANKALHIASGKISEVCSGKRKSAGKFNGHPIYWEKIK